MNNNVNNRYFKWLYDLVCKDLFSPETSFRKLFKCLDSIEFIYSIPNDENRAGDGINLRHRFSYLHSGTVIRGECSVLEMIIALAIRCEEDFMDDPQMGDRTTQWFWGMIVNLGLGGMTDNNFDEVYVRNVIDRLLYRQYKPDGTGGLFKVRSCTSDLRKVEIWHQLCWYINTIV